MSKSICSTIRGQIDEMMLGEECAPDVARHLSECRECRNFQQKEVRLRQIVGGLGTVAAPPDFDFRLRSRLARENSNSRLNLTNSFWYWSQRGALAAVAVVLVLGIALLMKRSLNRPGESSQVSRGGPSLPNVGEINNAGAPPQVSLKEGKEVVKETADIVRNPLTAKRSNNPRIKPPAVAEDFSGQRAIVVRGKPEAAEAVFPINTSEQSLKVSLFDGRGNPKTISLPTVTFGSQRVVPTATSYATKGVW